MLDDGARELEILRRPFERPERRVVGRRRGARFDAVERFGRAPDELRESRLHVLGADALESEPGSQGQKRIFHGTCDYSTRSRRTSQAVSAYRLCACEHAGAAPALVVGLEVELGASKASRDRVGDAVGIV